MSTEIPISYASVARRPTPTVEMLRKSPRPRSIGARAFRPSNCCHGRRSSLPLVLIEPERYVPRREVPVSNAMQDFGLCNTVIAPKNLRPNTKV